MWASQERSINTLTLTDWFESLMEIFSSVISSFPYLIKQELDSLDASSASVYKMMGPVLLRVELEDARQNVAKRLELIKTQMCVRSCAFVTFCECLKGNASLL